MSMTLKDSFRYQSFLDSLLTKTISYLGVRSNVTKATQEHIRSKENPDAKDESLDLSTRNQNAGRQHRRLCTGDR